MRKQIKQYLIKYFAVQTKDVYPTVVTVDEIDIDCVVDKIIEIIKEEKVNA